MRVLFLGISFIILIYWLDFRLINIKIYINDEYKEFSVWNNSLTVKEVLKLNNLYVDKDDIVIPDLTTKIKDNLTIRIYNVEKRLLYETRLLPYPIKK